MFYLQEIFDDLIYGELANSAAANPMAQTDITQSYPKLISLINRGLLDLHTRFKIKEESIAIKQIKGVEVYPIWSEITYNGEPVTLSGSDLLMSDNRVIRLLDAMDEDKNIFHIDNPAYPDEITSIGSESIRMVPSDSLKTITLSYQASYPRIAGSTNIDPDKYELYFPYSIKQALLLFVMNLLTVGKVSKGKEQQGTSYFYLYETECNRLSRLGLFPDKMYKKENFTKNGWA